MFFHPNRTTQRKITPYNGGLIYDPHRGEAAQCITNISVNTVWEDVLEVLHQEPSTGPDRGSHDG